MQEAFACHVSRCVARKITATRLFGQSRTVEERLIQVVASAQAKCGGVGEKYISMVGDRLAYALSHFT